MAYFYDIDDEEEKKKRQSSQPTGSTSSTGATSTRFFQEIEEPVKQQLEVKQEPIQEDVQPLVQQPVKQEPVQEVVQKPKNKIYSAINNAISFATGKMQEWGFTGESRGVVSEEKEKSLQQKDFEMTTGFSGENIPVVRNEMLKTNARDHIEYLDKVQKEVEELKQDNTLYLSKKRRELKEKGEEFDARELLEYKQKRLKEIALEMGYFSKEGLKAEDIKDITFADTQAEGLLSFIKEDKYLAQQNISLNDEVLGKVPVDKDVWNQVEKAFKSKTYLPSLLKGREAEFQEDYLLAMDAIGQGASINQLTPNQRSAIIRQTNKDWEAMVDRGLVAEAPQGLSDMTGYMVDLAIAMSLGGGNPLVAGAVGQVTSLPKTVQRVRSNTEDQFQFVPIEDKDGFRIMTTKLGTEDDVKGTVSALAGGYIETTIELLLGKGIDKLLNVGGGALARSGAGKKVLEAPITKKLGESFIVKSVSKVDNFLKKSPTAKFILQSTGLDSIAGEIAEELVQDMTNSITSGDEYEISTDYIADVASHTALLTFIAGGATRLGGAMTDAQTQAFVNEVNSNKQAYGLSEEAELTSDGKVVNTTTGEDITSGVLDGSQIVDKEGAFEGEVKETEGLEGQTEVAQEIQEQRSATELVEQRGLELDSINILNNEQSIVENEAGKEALLAEVPISMFGEPEFDTLAQDTYTKGERQITSPIEVTLLNDGSLRITDGANRFSQAVANEDVTIPAVVIKEDGTVPTLAEIEGKTMVQAPTRGKIGKGEITREVADKMTIEVMRIVKKETPAIQELVRDIMNTKDSSILYEILTNRKGDAYDFVSSDDAGNWIQKFNSRSDLGKEKQLLGVMREWINKDIVKVRKSSKPKAKGEDTKKEEKKKEPKKEGKKESKTKEEKTEEPREVKASKEVKAEGLVGENQKKFTYKGYEFITTETVPRSTPSPVPVDTSKKILMLYGQTKDGWTFVENKYGYEAFTNEQLDTFIGKYKDRLIKPKKQEVNDDKIAQLEAKAQAEYEKSWDSLTPQQQHKVLMSMEDGQRYIKTTDKDVLMKLGKGVDILSLKDTATMDKQEIFLWGGEREGLYTDGMILFTDKPVVKKIIDKFQEQYIAKEAQRVKKVEGISLAEAKKKVQAEFTKQRIEDMSFPETQPILDSSKANHKLTPIGFYADSSIRQSGSIIFRADNGTLVRLSGKYYSAIKSFYPSAEFYITDESNVKPISFVVGKSRKGIVMPMMMPDDATFNNLTGTTKLTAQEQRNINNASVMNDADVKRHIKDEFFAEIVYEKEAIKDIPYREGVISYGAGKYKFDKYGITVDMADGREYSFMISDIYNEITEQVKEEDRRSKLTEEERKKVEDDDIAFYTTARRRGKRGYDQIESMADIRRNLDILRKDRLRKKDVNVEENSKLVSNLLKYIGGNVKLSKQDIDALYSQAIGVDELQYDPNGYTTLYRIGEVEVGKQTAFSATKTDSENDIAYRVHRDDIVIYLNSEEFKDSLKNVDIDLVEGSNSIENLQEVFETYGSVENEVIATPREATQSDEQLMLTSGAIQPVAQEDTLITEARKYDSAEEFVEAQGKPLYHGGKEELLEIDLKRRSLKTPDGERFYAGLDLETAKRYGDIVTEIYLTDKNIKIADFTTIKVFEPSKSVLYRELEKDIKKYDGDTKNELWHFNTKKSLLHTLAVQPELVSETPIVLEFLRKRGYQASITPSVYGKKHFIVLDGGNFKTKTQLIKIWNQAQSETLQAKEDESKGSQSLETYEAREVTPAEQLKMSDEVKALVHKYADKVGEKYLPRGVLGVFYGKTREIRLKGITDLYVASHEISHAIDKKFDITAKITPRDSVDMQLREAYINLYPTAKETHAIKVQKMEGFAMAVSTYIQRPSSFTQEYPVIVKEMFTQGGKYYNREIGEYLNDVSNIVSRYQSLNDLDRVATRISKDIPVVEQTLFKSKTEATVNMLQNDLNLFERWVKENGDTMTKADFTNLFRFRTQVKQIYENNIATNLSKKNVEEGKFKNFMGGLYSYIRKSVAQDVYMVYNPETKNIEKKYDFNWGTLRREIAQKGMDRQFNSLLVARRAYYDFEYADKLRQDIETIKTELERLQDEVIEMYQKKGDERNKREEKAKEAEIAGTKVILQEVEENLTEVESLLKNDGWDRRLVTDAYMNNQGLFERELDMFDKLVSQDILLAKQVGIISQDKYNELKDNKGYAPFKRIIYDEVLGEVDPSEISGNLKLGSREISSLKKRTGSTKEIIYPLQSAMRNHMEFLNKSVSQDAINTFLTERTMEMHSANIKQVEWHKGIENQKDIIIRMEDGVRKAYAVDPMIKELIAGYLSPRQVDLLERVQQSYKQLFTIGTTGTYFQFVFTNLPRDAFNYITQTYQSSSIKAVYNLFADTAKVILGNNADNNLELQYFQKYLALGGREMTFVKYMEGDYDAFTSFLRQEEKGLKKVLNTLGKVAKVGLDVLSMPSQLSEMWYRSVEFIEAKKSGDSDVVALEKARRVTTPFHHRGSFKFKDSKGNIVKAPPIPKYAPFQNASLQAFAWAGGNFVKDPKIRSRMIFMIALTTALGLEELLRAWSGADDDDKEQFKDLSAEDLSRFIHMPKKGGGIRRIAVAEWAGSIAGTINMAVMDFILEDDVDYNVTDYATALTTSVPDQFNLLTPVIKLLEKGTWDEFGKWGTSLLPALANPIIAIMGYKTYPEFAPLESDWQKRKLPADRYNEGTSKFAKWAMSLELPFERGRLGDNLNLSPLQLDAILTQSFGRTIGMITGKPEAWDVLKSVNREYYFEYGRRLNDYWDTKEKNDQLYNSMTKGTREYGKEKELEVFRRKTISKDIDKALDEYREAYDSKDIERIESTRTRVIDLVTRYNENPSTPEMEIYLSNPNAKTMEEAMRARALREISMKDPKDYTKDELSDAKALAKEFRQEALLARSDYSYSELLFGINKNDDKVVKIEEVIEGKSEAEVKKYLASLKYAGMISNDVVIKLYNAGVIDYELGKWANDLESNRNF